MATVREILAGKGSILVAIAPEATVLDAALLMNEHRVGCVVVMQGGQTVGVFTERDILKRVVVPLRDPGRTLVREVMTTEMLCCEPDTPLEEARSVMKNRRIRHLPVVDQDRRLIGLVSIGDLNAYNANVHERTIHVLEQYIYGRV